MKLKTLLIVGAAIACAGPVFAQGMRGANYDANADGKVDKAEYAGGRVKIMLERLDTDKDGKIGAAEITAASNGGGGGGGMTRGLAESDADKDGALTAAELQASGEARFDLLDTNKDGGLSQEEMQAGRPPRPAQ